MKKLLIALLLVAVMITPAFAAIEKTAVEAQTMQLLSSVKGKLVRDSAQYTKNKQKIEDILADYLSNLDGVDQTKLAALPAEIQDIITAMNDLISKISTHYPSVE